MLGTRSLRVFCSTTGLALVAGLALAGSASAAPVMCTGHDENPQGITATHLLAKINGAWVEPENVCVAVTVKEGPGAGGRIDRGLYLGVSNTVDGGFPETHLPPGTEISLGLHLPDGMVLGNTVGRWRDVVVVTQGSDAVIQATTVQWDFHYEAYFGAGLDCSATPTVWPSTWGSYSSLNSLNPDRTPDLTPNSFAGAFYESNTVGAIFPHLQLDTDGTPIGLEVAVSGCGDNDPTTFEGYFNGFTPLSILHAYGMTDQMLGDLNLLQGMLEVYDQTSKSSVSAHFKPVNAGELTLEQIPGIAMPAPPAGPGIIGVRTDSQFSYSEHDLVQRVQPGTTAALLGCRSKGGTPGVDGGQLTCTGVPAAATPPPPVAFLATLSAPRSLKRGRPISVACNRPCQAIATLVDRGKRLASGRARSTVAGNLKVPLKLTPLGRRKLASKRALRARLSVVVTDPQGGRAELHRTLRLVR